MLLETIEYPKNLPFSVFLSNVAAEDFHYHNEMKLLFVLRGRTSCKIHNVLYTLEEGDLLIVDTKDMHRIYDSSKDVLMLSLYVDLSFYADLYPDIEYMIFACEDYSKASSLKHQDLQNKVSILKHRIAKTALAYINNKDNISFLTECINDLIFTLVNQFQGFFIEDHKFKADHGGPSDIDLSRLYQIIKYIYLNYDQKITLEDLSNIVYLNPYYISHLIKNTSGLSFQNFLNYVRVEYAEKLLVEGELTLTQISESCGFSSLSYFNKSFRAWYNITPGQYRAQRKPCERRFHGPFSEEAAISLLKSYVMAHHGHTNKGALSKSSHHIFIPVKYRSRSGKKLKGAFPLNVLLSSDEDVFIASYLKEKLRKLGSLSLVLDGKVICQKKSRQEVMSILSALRFLEFPLLVAHEDTGLDKQAESAVKAMGISLISSDNADFLYDGAGDSYTVCSALAHVLKTPGKKIRLSGSSTALFTPEGLINPFYSVYSIFARMNGIIMEQRDQYMIVKNKKSIYILILQENEDANLKVHIHIKDLRGKRFVVEKSYTKKHNCFETLKALDHPTALDDAMKAHADALSDGEIRLSCVNAKESLEMDFNMEPGTLTFVEIRE